MTNFPHKYTVLPTVLYADSFLIILKVCFLLILVFAILQLALVTSFKLVLSCPKLNILIVVFFPELEKTNLVLLVVHFPEPTYSFFVSVSWCYCKSALLAQMSILCNQF